MDLVALIGILALALEVDKLEDKRSPRYDATSSGEEVPADDVLENRRLSGGLRAYDNLERSVLSPSHGVARSSRAFARILYCIAGASAVGRRTIWGRSRESLPMVLKTRSWSLLTMLRSSSPSDAITLVDVCGFGVLGNCCLRRVNNDGLGGYRMDANAAQKRKVGSKETEIIRAEMVPGCLPNWGEARDGMPVPSIVIRFSTLENGVSRARSTSNIQHASAFPLISCFINVSMHKGELHVWCLYRTTQESTLDTDCHDLRHLCEREHVPLQMRRVLLANQRARPTAQAIRHAPSAIRGSDLGGLHRRGVTGTANATLCSPWVGSGSRVESVGGR